MLFLSRNALFLGARMWESAIEGRCNRSKLTCRVEGKMNATAEAIKRDGTSKKCSVWVRSGRMSYSKTRLAFSFSLLHLTLRME